MLLFPWSLFYFLLFPCSQKVNGHVPLFPETPRGPPGGASQQTCVYSLVSQVDAFDPGMQRAGLKKNIPAQYYLDDWRELQLLILKFEMITIKIDEFTADFKSDIKYSSHRPLQKIP